MKLVGLIIFGVAVVILLVSMRQRGRRWGENP